MIVEEIRVLRAVRVPRTTRVEVYVRLRLRADARSPVRTMVQLVAADRSDCPEGRSLRALVLARALTLCDQDMSPRPGVFARPRFAANMPKAVQTP